MTLHFRVLHVVPALFGADDGITGGAERYALELARYMADEVPTRLVTFGARDRTHEIGNLSLHVLGHSWYVRGQRNNPIAPGLFGEIRRAQIIHCHQRHVLASSLIAMAGRLSGRRVYVTDLGGGGWDLSAYVTTDQWYEGHLHISEYSRRIYQHENLASAQVILGGVDIEKFSPAKTERQRKVVYVGRLVPHKGIDLLVRAIPPGVELELIGKVCDSRYLDDLHRLAIGKHVNFRHDCDDLAIIEAYRTASCVVLPSVFRTMYGDRTPVPELLGQTLLEAMSCETPVICTDVASLPEVVVNGITGFVVPAHDPEALRDRIRWLLEHPNEGAAMGAAGRRHILTNFTWPAVVRRCLAAYNAPAT